MGIPLASSFDENAAVPLDSRTVVADDTARNAIPSGKRYEGLIVYVVADLANYQLQGGILDANWVVFDAGSSADQVSATLATASGATASTVQDSAGITWDIPLSSTDATAHSWDWSINGDSIFSISGTGDGAGGLSNGGTTIQFNRVGITLFTDPDLATPFTGLLSETVYGVWAEQGPAGAMQYFGVTSADTVALIFAGLVGATTITNPAIQFLGAKSDGMGGTADLAASEVLVAFVNNFSTSVAQIFGNGDMTILGEITANSGDVTTDFIVGARFAAGNDAHIGLNGGFDRIFDLSSVISDLSSSTNWYGLRSDITLRPSADATLTSIYGHSMGLIVPSSNTHDIGYVESFIGRLDLQGSGDFTLGGAAGGGIALFFGSGTVDFLDGVDGIVTHSGTGHINSIEGGWFQAGCTNASGSADQLAGVYIATPSAGGTVTAVDGLYIEDQVFAGASVCSIRTGVGAVQFGDHTSIGGASTNSVSILELISTTKGFMTPKMTTTQRNAITAVEALEVWDTTLHKKAQYNGTVWILSNDTIQSGTATLTAGTVTISAPITASSRILVTVKDANPGAGGLTIGFEAPSASRNVGAGTFVVRANVAAGTINVLDTSTLDWAIVG